jgi:hypothetical protein
MDEMHLKMGLSSDRTCEILEIRGMRSRTRWFMRHDHRVSSLKEKYNQRKLPSRSISDISKVYRQKVHADAFGEYDNRPTRKYWSSGKQKCD